MRKFTHNGEGVVYQVIDRKFLDILNSRGIIPSELPEGDLIYRVFRYAVDGVRKYACVTDASGADSYAERVLITESIPEDGFLALISDIQRQMDGSEPAKMKSRLAIASERAERQADKLLDAKYPVENVFGAAAMLRNEHPEEYRDAYKAAMCSFGYDVSIIDKISAPAELVEYVKGIMK